jgi:hypothetical protein
MHAGAERVVPSSVGTLLPAQDNYAGVIFQFLVSVKAIECANGRVHFRHNL